MGNNIKMYFRDVGLGDVSWTDLIEGRELWMDILKVTNKFQTQ
jgi:hypothetical protein